MWQPAPAPATVEQLGTIAATAPPLKLGSVAQRAVRPARANAAVTLLRLGEREKVLPVFEVTDDPEALTQFIFRCRGRGVGVDPLLDCLGIVSDGPVKRYPRNTRYALLLALGEFSLEEIPESRRQALLEATGRTGIAMIRVREYMVPRVGCCGNGGRRRSCARWTRPRCHMLPDREWFTLAITITPAAPPKPKAEPAKDNARSKPRSHQIWGPRRTRASAAPAEKAKLEPPAPPLPPKTFYYTFVVFPAVQLRHRIGQ